MKTKTYKIKRPQFLDLLKFKKKRGKKMIDKNSIRLFLSDGTYVVFPINKNIAERMIGK